VTPLLGSRIPSQEEYVVHIPFVAVRGGREGEYLSWIFKSGIL